MASKCNGEEGRRWCPVCDRLVQVVGSKLATHGPGPGGAFVCPGSGDRRAVGYAARARKEK